jgi:uncharacterized protein YcfJ
LRNKLMSALAIAVAAASVSAAPIVAEAATTKRVWVCDKVTKKANQGTAIGAVSGGILGNVVAGHGNKTEGTLLGAGVGGVAGHSIGKNKRKCHYEYRYR